MSEFKAGQRVEICNLSYVYEEYRGSRGVVVSIPDGSRVHIVLDDGRRVEMHPDAVRPLDVVVVEGEYTQGVYSPPNVGEALLECWWFEQHGIKQGDEVRITIERRGIAKARPSETKED